MCQVLYARHKEYSCKQKDNISRVTSLILENEVFALLLKHKNVFEYAPTKKKNILGRDKNGGKNMKARYFEGVQEAIA